MTDLVRLKRAGEEASGGGGGGGGGGIGLALPAAPAGYTVRLGPLAFVCPSDTVGEAVGDGLEAVGAALTAAERRPRPVKLTLPVRGEVSDLDPREAGLRLRRQLRQLLDNEKLRLTGFYFWWEIDAELDCWILVGGAEINETDPGISFGEYELTLNDVYLVGRPGTHRPGRRAAITDLKTGLAPRDSRRLLYSKDFSTTEQPIEPLMLPGDTSELMRSGNRPVVSTSLGPLRYGSRHPYRACSALDGEIVSYLPSGILPGRTRFLDIDEYGAVRVWSLAQAHVYPPVESEYSRERDEAPDVFYGWERVYGSLLTGTEPLAIENGLCRLIWLGPAISQGLAIEYWNASLERFTRIGRVLHDTPVTQAYIVELSNERTVVEWRRGPKAMRAILQRGWWGPRLESYDDGGATARLEYAPTAAGSQVFDASAGPSWVRTIRAHIEEPGVQWAQQTADELVSTSPKIISGHAVSFSRPRVLVAQLACPEGPGSEELAALSLVDCRPVPVLVARG